MRLRAKAILVLGVACIGMGCASSALVEEFHKMEGKPAAKKRVSHAAPVKIQPVTVENAEVVDVTEGQLYMECNVDSPFPQDYQIIRIKQLEPVLTDGKLTGEKIAERIYFILSATPIKQGSCISFRYKPGKKVTNRTLHNAGIHCSILETISLMGINGEILSYDIHCDEHQIDNGIATREEVEAENGHAEVSPAEILEPKPAAAPVEKAIATTELLE